MSNGTIADLIAVTLANAGVKRIWGVTGDSLNGLNDSLRRLGRIDWMQVRHEEVAAFAAARPRRAGSSRCAPAVVDPAIFILSMAYSTATAVTLRSSPSRRIFRPRRSASA